MLSFLCELLWKNMLKNSSSCLSNKTCSFWGTIPIQRFLIHLHMWEVWFSTKEANLCMGVPTQIAYRDTWLNTSLCKVTFLHIGTRCHREGLTRTTTSTSGFLCAGDLNLREGAFSHICPFLWVEVVKVRYRYATSIRTRVKIILKAANLCVQWKSCKWELNFT